MLNVFILCWNLACLVLSGLLNLVAIFTHLLSWNRRQMLPSRQKTAAAPAALVYLYVLLFNVVCIALVKFPSIHAKWFEDSFAFTDIVCRLIVIVQSSFECGSIITISILLVFLWHRQKVLLDQPGTPRLIGGKKQGLIIIILAILTSVVIGGCASDLFVYASAAASDRPSWNQYLVTVNVSENQSISVCRVNSRLHRFDTPTYYWVFAFRWVIGYLCPILLASVPSVLVIWRRTPDPLLMTYVRLSCAILWIEFVLQLPSLILDSLYLSGFYGQQPSSWTLESMAARQYVTYILAVMMSDLKLVYIPLATLIFLPSCRCCGENSAKVKSQPGHDNHDESRLQLLPKNGSETAPTKANSSSKNSQLVTNEDPSVEVILVLGHEENTTEERHKIHQQ